MNSYINPLTNQTTQSLVEELNKSYKINPDYFNRFNGFFKFFYKFFRLRFSQTTGNSGILPIIINDF